MNKENLIKISTTIKNLYRFKMKNFNLTKF